MPLSLQIISTPSLAIDSNIHSVSLNGINSNICLFMLTTSAASLSQSVINHSAKFRSASIPRNPSKSTTKETASTAVLTSRAPSGLSTTTKTS